MKSYYSLGLMSGTSMDGVDASIIQSDGVSKYKVILDKYFEYPKDIYRDLTKIRDKIKNSRDLKRFAKETKFIEKEITLFHARAVNEILKKLKVNVDFIGFHGQTIFHSAKEKISKQLGDGKFLSKLTKKTVVYDFRQNDLKNGGMGAPLSPIFHQLMVRKNKISFPVCVLNLGGIANVSFIYGNYPQDIISTDIGPGNCLIDEWVRKNSEKKYDRDGLIARSGKSKNNIVAKLRKNFIKIKKHRNFRKSLDINDFDLSLVRGLSLEDGAATLTDFTAGTLWFYIVFPIKKDESDRARLSKKFLKEIGIKEKIGPWTIVICGGGRKNKFLMESLRDFFYMDKNIIIKSIDDYGVNGDFVESQAFAYLAIRSYLKLPISFPSTTGVKKPCSGGLIYKS